MAKNEINILVTAKDLASGTLNKISGVSRGLSSSFAAAGEAAKTSFLIVGSAVVGLGGYMLKLAADAETLNTSLATAFQGNEEAAKSAKRVIIDFAKKNTV